LALRTILETTVFPGSIQLSENTLRCHVKTVITCYNCHFETLIKTHEKKAAAAFRDYVVLLNDDHGEVRAGTYQ